jgi:hypothetical protein
MEDAHAGHGGRASLNRTALSAEAIDNLRWLVRRGMGHAVLHAHHH